MHELSIALSILEVVEEHAEQRPGRVSAVHLKLGPLCGVVKEALVSAYELAREGTALHESRLVIEDVPLVAWCPACSVQRTLPSVQQMCCPDCGTPTPDLVSGRELEVVSFEIEP